MLYADFNYPDSATDPIQIVRRFERPDDREVVGFCAAALAFGRVASVLQSIERLLAVMGDARPPTSGRSIRARGARRSRASSTAGSARRDLVALLWLLQQMLDRVGIDRSGSSSKGYDAGAPDVGAGARQLLDAGRWRSICGAPTAACRSGPGVCYFFPRPSAGSACKRLNLFLRWMVRRDALDLGVWTRVPPSALVVPLDTHVIRVGRCLRLTRYTSPGLADGARHHGVAAAPRSGDPVKYDFSLCHLGMMNACGFNRAQKDSQCPLRGVCRPRAA